MKPKSLRHITHYLILLIVLLAGVIATVLVGKSTFLKAFIIVFMGLAYFSWGIIHHYIEKDLHPHIVIEYLLISTLGAASVIGVLFYL